MRRRGDPAAPPPASGASIADAGPRNSGAGILRFDDEKARLPESLAEAGEIEANGLMPGRALLVIATLAVIFISIIAWFVSRMPPK